MNLVECIVCALLKFDNSDMWISHFVLIVSLTKKCIF